LNKVKFEFSSGGVVINNNEILCIKVKNLEGKFVWTLPKGHIEKNEKPEDTALREVEEETGYKCEIIRYIDKVEYWFKEDNQLIKKTVKWFLMKPIEKIKEHNYEIEEKKWFNISEIFDNLVYKSDIEIVKKICNQKLD